MFTLPLHDALPSSAHRCESRPGHHPVGITGHPAVAPEADSDGRRDLLAEVRPARPRPGARARSRDDAGAVAGVMPRRVAAVLAHVVAVVAVLARLRLLRVDPT